jgi:predicted hydrocarbon binding protein
MYGLILSQLKKYVEGSFGGRTWSDALDNAGITTKAYVNIREYPDEDAAAVVAATAKQLGKSTTELLEEFGEYAAPRLMDLYQPMIEPEWKTLDLIEHTEETIHQLVRRRNPGAKPPALKCTRASADEVVITYNSPRRMCGVAKGLAKGVARIYEEPVQVTEKSCMHKGDSTCIISVKRQ